MTLLILAVVVQDRCTARAAVQIANRCLCSVNVYSIFENSNKKSMVNTGNRNSSISQKDYKSYLYTRKRVGILARLHIWNRGPGAFCIFERRRAAARLYILNADSEHALRNNLIFSSRASTALAASLFRSSSHCRPRVSLRAFLHPILQ